MDTVIKRVLAVARQKGMDQSQLARAMGVLPQHVTNWKKRGFPADQYENVANVLGCSIDYLLGRKAMTPPLDPLEEQLLEMFRRMNEEHRDDLLSLANRWYSIDNPADRLADPFRQRIRKAS